MSAVLQKREQQGDNWSPKFFAPAPSMGVLPGEETAEAVPLWAWNNKYSEAKQQPEVQDWEGTRFACLSLAAPRRVSSGCVLHHCTTFCLHSDCSMLRIRLGG